MLIKAGVDMICKICKQRPAEIRDRNDPTSRKKTVCKNCHGKRLLEDLVSVLMTGKRRNQC